MKTLLNLGAGLLLTLTVNGQTILEDSVKVDEIPSYRLAFENLPEDKRRAYMEHKSLAEQYFGQKRTFECLEEIHHASEIFDQDPSLWNLKGSCHVGIRSFAKAREDFLKSLALEPNNLGILFNLAEMDFVTKEWEAAAEKFQNFAKKIEEESKDKELEGSALELHRLAEIKRLISLLKLERDGEAKELAEKYSEFDNTPMAYYVKALMAYEVDDSEQATEWLQSAIYVFDGIVNLTNWQDAIIEAGYIQSFYGGDNDRKIEIEE